MPLSTKFDAKHMEAEARRHLDSLDLDELIHKSGDSAGKTRNRYRFIEGPPTMNGIPHAGHLRGRIIKDFWYRFNTLQGNIIEFNGGWDTQGLPVELQAEKELGVTGGKSEAIKQFGVERIVAECKTVVKKYNDEWVRTDALLGISLNHERAYWTHHDSFIEREWSILQKAHDNDILEEDYAVIAYCPSCQTSLSHAEVSQGYEQVRDPSLYYKVRLEEVDDTYLVVWTTMPFTLVTDAMIGLHPQEDYCYVRVHDGQTWIVGNSRLHEFMSEIKMDDYEVIKTVKGSEFEGMRYVHPLLDLIPELARCAKSDTNYHTAVAEQFVDASTGSGLVHLSPANGEEDIKVANKRGIKIFSPIDDEAKLTHDAGKYRGMFVRDADRPVTEDLKERGALVHIAMIKHKYPLCWRSHHRLVWLARRGWFYKLDRLGDKAVNAATSVEYFFEQPKNRFLGIIKERHPWCISRERVWGCPLPVWDCSECGHKSWFFSRAQILQAAADLPDGPDFELHRPWIDNITMTCAKCNSTNTHREEYVLDTWHNSGSAPYSSLTDEQYTQEIPAQFCTEGIDQTRGWAYTQLIENVILNNSPAPPYMAFLFQGHVLDAHGGKMSKSKGNVLVGSDLLEEHPVDLVRLYFMWKVSPIEPLSFSIREMVSRPYQILNTLFNLHLYFQQNSTYDDFAGSGISGIPEHRQAEDVSVTLDSATNVHADQSLQLSPPDIWLLSKLQALIHKVAEKAHACRFHEAVRALEDFVINDLSQTYIPLTRGELWSEDDSDGDDSDGDDSDGDDSDGDDSDGDGDGDDSDGDVNNDVDNGANTKNNNTARRRRRMTIYTVLEESLRALDIMFHPICPFSSEYMYQASFTNTRKSILLEEWPRYRKDLVNRDMEESFDVMTEIASVSASARMKAHLKRRWPLDGAKICVNHGMKNRLQRQLSGLLRSQLNVEKYEITEINHQWWEWDGLRQVSEMMQMGLPARPVIDLERKRIGPKARQYVGELVGMFEATDKQVIFSSLCDHGKYTLVMRDGHKISLDAEDFTISLGADDGFEVARRDGQCIVFITTSRNAEMTARGLVKDIARRLQVLRKERGYNPTDMLDGASVIGLDDESLAMMSPKADDLAFLVRARHVVFEQDKSPLDTAYKNDEIDGQKIRITVW